MTPEERIVDAEQKILEQEKLITELYQAVINQQRMINDGVVRQNELQQQLTTLSETLMLIANRK
jgi:uncharacterized coiled-coil protein SlyX